NRAISTEITGYTISTLVYLYSLTHDEQYLDAAALSAQFLKRSAWDSALGLFPFENGRPALAYFFDSGIIVRGLLALFRVTGDRELLEVAKLCGQSMAQDFAAGKPRSPPLLAPPRQ